MEATTKSRAWAGEEKQLEREMLSVQLGSEWISPGKSQHLEHLGDTKRQVEHLGVESHRHYGPHVHGWQEQRSLVEWKVNKFKGTRSKALKTRSHRQNWAGQEPGGSELMSPDATTCRS